MKYATIKYDDIANCPGLAVSVYTQGCPHHCPGCFNESTWDFNGGIEFTEKNMNNILQGLRKNNIYHSLCILGGEPLCEENLEITNYIIQNVLTNIPETKIYIWSGYLLENLIKRNDELTNSILSNIDYLIDGPFIQEQRDVTLHMRGSRNQRVIDVKETLKQNRIILSSEVIK